MAAANSPAVQENKKEASREDWLQVLPSPCGKSLTGKTGIGVCRTARLKYHKNVCV
jgi:hypothetical protein